MRLNDTQSIKIIDQDPPGAATFYCIICIKWGSLKETPRNSGPPPYWAGLTGWPQHLPTHTSTGWGLTPTLPQINEKRHCYIIVGFENSLLSVWFPCSPAHLRGCYLLNWSYLREWVYFDWIWLSHLNLRALGLVRNINTISSSKKN